MPSSSGPGRDELPPPSDGPLGLTDELAVQVREGLRVARVLERNVHELESALESSAEELRASFRRTVRARDEERRRVMRDLHDGAQQQLLAIGVELDLAAADPEATESLARKLRRLRAQLDDALRALRDTARGIYPAALADHGIVEGLRAATLASNPPVTVHGSLARRYAAEIEGAVYYSCLEAVQNAVKHARATRIEVEVDERDGSLDFAVVDDGSGFDPTTRRRGAGLQNVSDRVRATGGQLRIASTAGSGTTVSGSVPIRDGEAPTRT